MIIAMPVNIEEWNGHLQLHDVDEKPEKPLDVKFGSVCVEKLGQILTPTQVGSKAQLYYITMTQALYSLQKQGRRCNNQM